MRLLHTSLLVVLASCLPRMNASSQEQPSPYSAQGSVAAILEDEFTKVIAVCGIPKIYKDKSQNGRERTAIPNLVKQELGIDFTSNALVVTGNSPARIMYYVYRQGEAKAATPADPRRLLDFTEDVSPLSMTRQGTSVTAHAHSCSSVVAAATAAGVNVPGNYLKAALEANYRNDQSSRLVLVIGQFFSPFSLTAGIGGKGASLRDLLTAWNWYVSNPGEANRRNEYISKITGISLYRVANAHRGTGGKLDISTAASLPGIASFEASLKAALATDDVTNVRAFAVVLFKSAAGLSAVEVSTFPTPTGLSTDLARYTLAVQPDAPAIVVIGTPHVHWQELRGMPTAMCDRNAWVTEKDSSVNGQVDLVSATPQPNETCRFTVRYSAADRDAAKGSDIRLGYGIKSTVSVGNSHLRFAATPLRLTTTDAPRVHLLAFDPRWTRISVVANNVASDSLRWDVRLEVDDDGNAIDPNALMRLDQPSLTCGQIQQPANYSIDQPGGTKRATIRITRPIFGGDAFDEAAVPLECIFSSGVRLSLARTPGVSVLRGIPGAKLRFPSTRSLAVGK